MTPMQSCNSTVLSISVYPTHHRTLDLPGQLLHSSPISTLLLIPTHLILAPTHPSSQAFPQRRLDHLFCHQNVPVFYLLLENSLPLALSETQISNGVTFPFLNLGLFHFSLITVYRYTSQNFSFSTITYNPFTSTLFFVIHFCGKMSVSLSFRLSSNNLHQVHSLMSRIYS